MENSKNGELLNFLPTISKENGNYCDQESQQHIPPPRVGVTTNTSHAPPPKFSDQNNGLKCINKDNSRSMRFTFSLSEVWKKRTKKLFFSLLTHLGVLVMIAAYSAFGAKLFLYLEREADISRISNISNTIEKHKSNLEDYLIKRDQTTQSATMIRFDQCVNMTLQKYRELSDEAENYMNKSLGFVDNLIRNRTFWISQILGNFEITKEQHCNLSHDNDEKFFDDVIALVQPSYPGNSTLLALTNSSNYNISDTTPFDNATLSDDLSLNITLLENNTSTREQSKLLNLLYKKQERFNVLQSNNSQRFFFCLEKQRERISEALEKASFEELLQTIANLRKKISLQHTLIMQKNAKLLNFELEKCRKDINNSFPQGFGKEFKKLVTTIVKSVFSATLEGWTVHHDNIGNISTLWTLTGSMLYSVTVISTIGYGHIAPKTTEGRMVTILYALVGIPLMLICLQDIGGVMARTLQLSYKYSCGRLCVHKVTLIKNVNADNTDYMQTSAITTVDCVGVVSISDPLPPLVEFPLAALAFQEEEIDFVDDTDAIQMHDLHGQQEIIITNNEVNNHFDKMEVRIDNGSERCEDEKDDNDDEEKDETIYVPMWLTFLVMVFYLIIGALVFKKWEEWEFSQSCYFCFITLSTIGFGDLVPGTKEAQWTDETKPIFCTFYLIFGLAVLSMSFQLMQEEVSNIARKVILYIKAKMMQ